MPSAIGALRALQTLGSSLTAGSSSFRQAARRPAHFRGLQRSGVCLAAKQVEVRPLPWLPHHGVTHYQSAGLHLGYLGAAVQCRC